VAHEARHARTFRVPHFSIQRDHLHLIVEAEDGHLSSGIRGLVIAMARRLNQFFGRVGRIWADRYHRRDLTSPRQTKNALTYVLNNDLKHALRGPETIGGRAEVDVYSSAFLFDGWSMPTRQIRYRVPWPVTMAPRTWMLSRGWRAHGLLDPRTIPGSTRVRS
jgi:REP element-mobilizing transposase RayT